VHARRKKRVERAREIGSTATHPVTAIATATVTVTATLLTAVEIFGHIRKALTLGQRRTRSKLLLARRANASIRGHFYWFL
jgi:hypothetical protein